MLQCASFSDHCLHTRGSFEAFRRSSSARKWLTTHRSGKWSWFYSDRAHEEQLAFFDHVLKGLDNGSDRRPPVVVRIYEEGPEAVDALEADAWPPAELEWTTLHLDATTGRLGADQPASAATASVGKEPARFTWTAPYDVDLIGPMALHLAVSLPQGGDVNLFVTARKFHRGR